MIYPIKTLFLSGLFIICFICCKNSFAQGTSNKGKEFWVAYQGHLDNTNSRLTLFITSDKNAVVNINAGGTALPAINVTAGSAVPVVINPNTYTNTYLTGSDVIQNKAGILVSADVDIIVYAHLSFAARSASTLVLPVKALGNEYYAIAYNQVSGTNRYSEFCIVGVEDNTVVEIRPTSNSLNNSKAAGASFQITLNKGDAYQYKSPNDVTGSYIKTVGGCKPIAVFSGSTFNSFCTPSSQTNPSSGDPLYQQLFPTSAWGQNFITAPFFNAQNGSSDIIRIQVLKDNTTIKVNGSTTDALGSSLSNPYSAGSVVTYVANTPSVIEASSPISVAQIQVTQNCNPNSSAFPGDPELTLLNPIEQTLKDITVYSAVSVQLVAPTNITKHYLNIILKKSDNATLKVDGSAPQGNFVSINTDYNYITVDVTASSAINPSHRITSNGGFIAIAYGYGNVESYAYLAGADLKNLNANIELFPPGSISKVTNLCVGKNYDIQLQLPYITTEIKWDLNSGQTINTIANPTYTSTIIGGKTFYIYKYAIAGSDLLSAGNKTIKATVQNPAPTSCSASEEIMGDFVVYAIPKAEFIVNSTNNCPQTPVLFTDKSSINGEVIKEWYWDFGDGTAVEKRLSAAAFGHTFAQSGNYNIKLYVVSENGCASDVFSTNVYINKLPIANFTHNSPTCELSNLNFTDRSINTDGNIVSWAWDFGDPTSSSNTSNLQNPTHQFQLAGVYEVKLVTTTNLGCSNVMSKQVFVKPQPKADFDAPDICLNDAVATFTNKSTIADNSSLSYAWNFGDPASGSNNISNLRNPSHTYSAAANYNVTLSVTSAAGCVEIISKVFTVNGSTPKADFRIVDAAKLCVNQPVVFEDKATVDFGEITKIKWVFDVSDPATTLIDESPSLRTAQPKVYSYTYPVFYTPAQKTVTVKMVAYSGNSSTCVSEVTKTITLLAVPKANFDLPGACLLNGVANFTNQSSFNGLNEGLNYTWDFGDPSSSSNISSSLNPTHQYSQAGVYKVRLSVVASNGCTSFIEKDFLVKGALAEPKFSVGSENNLCSDQKVVFRDEASLSFGEIKKIEWYFDVDNHPTNPNYILIDNSPNPRSSTAKSYEFLYPVFHTPLDKLINVKMVVFSGDNCSSEVTKTVTLKAVPNLTFENIPSICLEVESYHVTQAKETTGFVGIGTYAGKGITNNGLFTPSVAGIGTHLITYTFAGSNGCIVSKSQNVVVHPSPVVIAGTDQTILVGGEIILDASASGKNLQYKWTPATGLDKDDILNPKASPKENTTYTLTARSEDGCVMSDQIFIKVLQYPEIPNTFTPNGDGVNDTWAIKYLESYPSTTVKVFNRHGLVVYSATNYQNPWDGSYQGTELPAGLYYYIITAKDNTLKYSGSVMILK